MDPLSFDQLLADIREELDDDAEPFLWSSDRLGRLINEAITEANLRAHLILDHTTTDICTIAVAVGVAEYALHPSIIVIERATLASDTGRALTRTSEEYLEYLRGIQWRTETGTPDCLIRTTRGQILLSPIPDKVDTLTLKVWRNPSEDETLGPGDDLIDAGIPAEHHAKLLHWICYRALSKRDAESQALREAEFHLSAFETHFGPRPTAAQLQRRAMDAGTPTRPVWF